MNPRLIASPEGFWGLLKWQNRQATGKKLLCSIYKRSDYHAGTLVTLRSNRLVCGRTKEPPPYS
jgi:hypothetical protein